MSICSAVFVQLMSTANGIFFCSSGATTTLSTSLTQIRAYLLTSRRLSLSLTRPGQILGTQSSHFLSSSLEILLQHSRHDVVHRWRRRRVTRGRGGGSPPGSTSVLQKIHKNSPYISRQAFFLLCRDGVKLCHGPRISIKQPPTPCLLLCRRTRENTQVDPVGFPVSLGSLSG